MTLFQLYLFTVLLPNAHETFDFLSGVLTLIGIGLCVLAGIVAGPLDETENAKKILSAAFKCLIPGIILMLLCIPLPSEKQIYTLAGGYVATNTKDIAKLPDNVIKAANAWLEKAADASKPTK